MMALAGSGGPVGCQTVVEGQACVSDETCGPGYDCYEKRCHRVCTENSHCAQAQRCDRYRCVQATAPGEPAPSAARPGYPGRVIPPTPDPVAAELRALRREVEMLRRDVGELLDRKDRGRASGR